MDFTREPIIETIISPKDGFKLSIKSSRYASQEEYLVNAVEVVSFGKAFFFRSLEKPKPFLLPASDYEIVEVKEAKMVLKNVSVDKPIKIGEGKEGKQAEEKETAKPETENKKSSKKKGSRKRRSKSDNSSQEKQEAKKAENPPKKVEPVPSVEGGDSNDEAQASSSVTPRVFPTPPKIIGRKLPIPESEEVFEGNILSDELISDSEPSLQDDSHHAEEIANLDSPEEKVEEQEAKKED